MLYRGAQGTIDLTKNIIHKTLIIVRQTNMTVLLTDEIKLLHYNSYNYQSLINYLNDNNIFTSTGLL